MIAAPRPATVLVIDDDRLNRVALAELLQSDHRVLLARDGASGLATLEREQVQLVLLDVSMPGMDGYEVLRKIRENDATRNLPVIFITGMSDAADEERGLLLGAADFVRKPIRPAVVRARVMTHLRLAQQRNEMQALAALDSLTGIANRRSFDEALDHAIHHAARAGLGLSLGFFDVDHFKQFNDRYGHSAGDEALRCVATRLQSFARRTGDIAARYGGEEFVILLPECENLETVMKKICYSIAEARIPHESSSTAEWLTVSGGGVVLRKVTPGSAKSALELADRLLYRAKANGRDRVIVDEIVGI
ncbi:diguanylate cyclase [Xinfangfangia sp. D13-10-4-6]|uniref:GGDEF domain-containing response regulator n=1 Tax=Pseudogemmobacter hezensis TaxID=2737662 RepID=UPI0015559A62|nr:diguanylate cyclase [Pseudogemmobacter hezensis]NPD14128.1 diguanylate cyclase [Pseudogemmobacter hezensis]